MFGLGTWELILILVVAVLFLGPDKLPELAKTLGRSVRSIQRAMGGVETSVRPVQQAARKLNESIDRAVDLDGTEDNEEATPENAPPEQDVEPQDCEQQRAFMEGAHGAVAAADPLGPRVTPDNAAESALDGASESAEAMPEHDAPSDKEATS